MIKDIEQQLIEVCEGQKLYLREDLTQEKLAKAIHTNRTYVWAYFKMRNMSVKDYITTLRMRVASELLKNTDLKVEAVCVQSGYGHMQTFRRHFNETFRMTPSEYRRFYGIKEVK